MIEERESYASILLSKPSGELKSYREQPVYTQNKQKKNNSKKLPEKEEREATFQKEERINIPKSGWIEKDKAPLLKEQIKRDQQRKNNNGGKRLRTNFRPDEEDFRNVREFIMGQLPDISEMVRKLNLEIERSHDERGHEIQRQIRDVDEDNPMKKKYASIPSNFISRLFNFKIC